MLALAAILGGILGVGSPRVVSVAVAAHRVLFRSGERAAPDVAPSDAFVRDAVVVERAQPPAEHWQRDRLALVVAPGGASRALGERFLHLGIPVAFVVDPHALQAAAMARAVRAASQMLYVQVGKAPSASPLAALRLAIGAFDGVASRDARGMPEALADTGLAFFDERGTADPASFVGQGVTLVRRDVTVDDVPRTAYVAYMLREALDRSRRYGEQVVLMRPTGASLAALRSVLADGGAEFASTR